MYSPTLKEIGVSLGIYALGAFVFTILVRGGVAIELGRVRMPGVPAPAVSGGRGETIARPVASGPLDSNRTA